jgi:Tfp pilus assembly protein PilO
MKKLTPEKRNHLILTIIVTLAMISMVYFFLIGPQNRENQKLVLDTASLQTKLDQIKQTIKSAGASEQAAVEVTTLLNQAETDVASGDYFAWVFDTIRKFKTGHQLEIPNIGQPEQAEVNLLAGFPYKQIAVTLQGSGYYHDIGKFISDLENKFPHIRVVNLTLEPAGSQNSEKLTFRMEVIALTKTSA